MTEKLLKARHWQLFLLTFGILFAFQVIMMVSIMTSVAGSSGPEPEVVFGFLKLLPVVMIIFMAVFFGWFWAVGTGLQSLVPPGITLKVNRFKAFLIIPVSYIIVFVSFILFSISSGGPNPVIFAIILPLHLFSMFCIFYCLYFVAKTFKTVELQREVTFSDFAGEFFMIWFFPIGIWIIQPKINRLIAQQENKEFTI